MICKTSGILACLPTNILKEHLCLKRRSSEDTKKDRCGYYIIYVQHPTHKRETYSRKKENYGNKIKEVIPYRIPFIFLVDYY